MRGAACAAIRPTTSGVACEARDGIGIVVDGGGHHQNVGAAREIDELLAAAVGSADSTMTPLGVSIR
jgi:hypothetical protein